MNHIQIYAVGVLTGAIFFGPLVWWLMRNRLADMTAKFLVSSRQVEKLLAWVKEETSKP